MSQVTDGVSVDRIVVEDGRAERVQYRLQSAADEPLDFSLHEVPRDDAEGTATPKTEIGGVIYPGETLVLDAPPTGTDGSFVVPGATELRLTTHPASVAADGGQSLEGTPQPSRREPVRTDRPAVGLVATAGNESLVSRAIARAAEGGLAVYVAHTESADPEFLEFVERLGGQLVPVDSLETEMLREALVTAARLDDCPGILLRSVGADSVAFDTASTGAFEDLRERPAETPDRESWNKGETVVGIPAYNEASTIESVVREASAFADTVLVVDDGSRDDTAARAERAGARVIRHGTNRGYGAALRSVFTEAAALDAQNLAIVDGDGQHDPAEMRSLLECQRETGADLVIGSRFVEGAETDMPTYRRFGIEVVNVLTNAAIGRLRDGYVRDTQSGFRVYGHRAIESLAEDTTIGAGMNASTDIVFHAAHHGYEIAETPIDVSYEVENANTHNPVIHGLHLVANILGHVVRERPVESLGVPGAILMMVGVLVWFWASIGVLGSAGSLGVALSVLLLCSGVTGTVAGLALGVSNERYA
jgi:glycosyltransferase involved in cell wall biosynthesis